MEVETFDHLCKDVEEQVGEEEFKPELYLLEKLTGEEKIPPIAGEVKMAIAIRMLAGGSYLDLIPLFGVCQGSVYNVFNQFLDWILATLEFPLVEWLRMKKWGSLYQIRDQFAEQSNGVFNGVMGALDGVAIRIRCPRLSEVPDTGNYYCRKGFYALNVQAISDKAKRFLWCYPTNKGSTHDSAGFAGRFSIL